MCSASRDASAHGAVEEILATEDDKASLEAWGRSVPGTPYADSFHHYMREVRTRIGVLPPWYRQAAIRYRRRLGHAGILRIRALPIPYTLGRTPLVPYTRLREPVGTEAVLLAFAALMGETVGFADWHGGDHVQNMYPLIDEAGKQNASNSVYLEMHTETAFRPNTPHAVLLLCLRDEASAYTLFCDLHRVWSELTEEDRARLAEPGYAFSAGPDGLTPAKPIAIVSGGLPRFNYAEALVGVRPDYAKTLERFREATKRHCFSLGLSRGDLVVIDNIHMIHGRTAYRPRYDGSDRWLQRSLVRLTAGTPS